MKKSIAIIGQVKGLRNIFHLAAVAMVFSATSSQGANGSISKTFEFGPGTTQHHSHMRTFYIPAHSVVGFAVQDWREDVTNVPVIIDVHRPDEESLYADGPDGPLADSVSTMLPANHFVEIPGPGSSYVSDLGCPSTWRVRVRTANGQAPPVKVTGTITALYSTPDPTKLTIGSNQNIGRGDTKTRIVSPYSSWSPSISKLGSGTIRIKAKWHTDPLDVFNFGKFYKLKVSLLRPDGTVADTETGYSMHAPSDKTPKVSFAYNPTLRDFAMSGDWKLRIENNSGVDVVDFNIEKGFDLSPSMPSFKSTFTPGCY